MDLIGGYSYDKEIGLINTLGMVLITLGVVNTVVNIAALYFYRSNSKPGAYIKILFLFGAIFGCTCVEPGVASIRYVQPTRNMVVYTVHVAETSVILLTASTEA